MTLSALKSDLAALMMCHPMMDTNVDGVTVSPLGVVLNTDARDDALMATDDAEQEVLALGTQLRESESENTELTRQVCELEERLDDTACSDYPETMRDLTVDRNTWQGSCKEWAIECQGLRNELTALRKRKGVDAGLFVSAREVMTFLRSLAATSPEAKAVLTKIQNSI